MSNQVNYKQKYLELKQKFMESVDTAFALGFEQGQVQAQQDQMMQQQQMAQEAAQQQEQGGFGEGNGAEGSPAGAEQMANPNGGEMPSEPDSMNPAGSELDQHIEKLESMVSKSEVDPKELMGFLQDLRKSASDAKQASELKKSSMAIKGISKALHKPAFKLGQQASHNMNANAKAAVSMQHKIVNDIMKAWDDESSKASKDIKAALDLSALTKKE